ncbi:unnamed protein product [Calicophoron daubneyi]|uniref:G-protein coupled receptors family 1 profile domain-containing protein n=1 Tax=Calicophoron daubneyi TaxID=300641 RepID=A0AAV2T167_CALDB
MRVMKTNFTYCFVGLSALELFGYCHENGVAEHVAQISAGISGVLVLATTIFGVLSNCVLAYLLTFRINLPRHLEIFGRSIAAIDVLFILHFGAFVMVPVYGLAWWNMALRTLGQHNHFSCKMDKLFSDFLLSARVNLALITLLNELRPADRLENAGEKICIWAKIVMAMTISFIHSLPGAITYGICQDSGVFICEHDFQWSPTLHKLVAYHDWFFCWGEIQCVCLALLLWILRRRNIRFKHIINLLHGVPIHANPISLTVITIEGKLLDYYRCYRIVFTHTVILCVIRPVFGMIGFALFFFWPVTNEPGQLRRMMYLVHDLIERFTILVEVVAASFSLMWWYANISKIQQIFHQFFGRLLCRRLQTKNLASARWREKHPYYARALDTIGNQEVSKMVVRMKCQKIRKGLRTWETYFRTQYANELLNADIITYKSEPSSNLPLSTSRLTDVSSMLSFDDLEWSASRELSLSSNFSTTSLSQKS